MIEIRWNLKHYMMGIEYLIDIGYHPNDILFTTIGVTFSNIDYKDMWYHITGEPDLFTISDDKYWEIKKFTKIKNSIYFNEAQIKFLNENLNSNIIIFSRYKKFVAVIQYNDLINKNCKYKIKKLKTKAKI